MEKDKNSTNKIYSEVKDYYGKELTQSTDLKTNACCTAESISDQMKQYLKDIHTEVSSKYYGCGLVAPQLLEGMRILDLGSGSGQDCYLLSRLVGESGYVIGVDMTDEQLNIANKHIDYHTKKYGYKKPNVEFRKGYIEKLDELGFEDNSFDIVISNCVVNLSPDKNAVLREVYRVLKPGGEMYFSDVYSDRRIKEDLQNDPVLYGECLSGALYYHDFIRLARKNGFIDPRVMKSSGITIENKDIEKRIGHIKFDSVTFRLFKIDELEDQCEDFGQAISYKGTIPDSEYFFQLDDGHIFEKGRAALVCGNSYMMLKKTRFGKHFDYFGDMSTHYGIFPDCGGSSDSNEESVSEGGSCC